MAAWKKTDTNDRTPATTQVTDWSRPTGMPSMEVAVAAVSGGLDGNPDVALGEPEGDPDQARHRDDHRDQIVGVQDDRIEVPGRVPRKADHRGGDGV